MKKLILQATLLLMCAVFAFSGCSGGNASSTQSSQPDSQPQSAGDSSTQPSVDSTDSDGGDKYKIGFSINFSGNTWRAICIESLKQEVEKHDNIEFVMADAQNDINKQVNDIESLIAQEVDAILVLAGSAQAVEPVLANAKERGIKVVVFDMPLENDDSFDVYVGTDKSARGERVTRWMCEKLGGEGKLVCLGGTAGGSGTAMFLKGAEKVLEEYPNVEMIAYKDTDYKEDVAKMAMADMLLAYPEIDGVLCDTGASATGAWKAMLAAEVPLIPVTGTDYNGMFRLYLENHEGNPGMDFGAISEPTWQSREALLAAIRLLEGSQEERWQYLTPDLLTGESAAEKYLEGYPDSIMVDVDLPLDKLKELVK